MVNDEFGNDAIKNRVDREIRQAFIEMKIPLSLASSTPSKRLNIADFQCNSMLSHANSEGRSPRDAAEEAKTILLENNIFDVSVAGPGFLNFRILDEFLINQINEAPPNFHRKKSTVRGSVSLDFGGPNVAKEMHVGHLRSALIGQSLAAVLRFCGYQVTSDVHLGDWGLQMGLTIAQIKGENLTDFDAADLERIYPAASLRSKEDPEFLNHARACTANLQANDAETMAIWKKMVSISITEIKRVYDRLGVSFDQWNGESRYQNLIRQIIKTAHDKGIAEHSDGAQIIRFDNNAIAPLILQTSAGSVGYAATDLAALGTRVSDHAPDEILYIVDKRQKLHFEQVFLAAQRIGLIGSSRVEHVPFGTVNGHDGRPYKTRDGQVMRLRDLLDLMHTKARARVVNRGVVQDIDAVAVDIAMSAVIYGELSHDRASNYVFDSDRFLAFEGNTGPYLLYTSVRVNTLISHAADQGLYPGHVTELGDGGRKIALTLDGFYDALRRVIQQRKPSILAAHLYGLANEMNGFYQKNPVLAQDVREGSARAYLEILRLADTQLRTGLNPLGIRVPNQM